MRALLNRRKYESGRGYPTLTGAFGVGLVVCDHGLLHSEMIGTEGRETVVAPSFYDWLKALIETDGDLTKVYPRYPSRPRLVVDDEPDQT